MVRNMASRKIKVLHMITELPVGGAQDNTLLTIEHLDKEKYDVTLLSSPGGSWVNRARRIQNVRVLLNTKLQRRIHPIQNVLGYTKSRNGKPSGSSSSIEPEE